MSLFESFHKLTAANATATQPDFQAVVNVALAYQAAGLSVLPIRCDGTKAPALDAWKKLQANPMTELEIQRSFTVNVGVGIICGAVSGNLEVIDFDAPELFEQWCDLLKKVGGAGLLEKLVIIETPGGWHIAYRCSEEVEGNQKLACRRGEGGRPETLIETRGEGGYVIAPGSPSECHPTKRLYELKQNALTDLPTIGSAERQMLLQAARSFHEIAREYQQPSSEPQAAAGVRPGDAYNEAVSVDDLLSRHGWQLVYKRGGQGYWKRPGKTDPGISATTNHNNGKRLYVFSSNAAPFEPDRNYSAFQAFAVLEHNGDFKAAAKAIAAKCSIVNAKSNDTAGDAHPDVPDWSKPETFGEPVLFGAIETPEIDSTFLPSWVKAFVDALSASTQTPPAMAVMLVLPVLAACLQKRFEVSPTGDDYTEILAIWSMVALPPASRKTKVLEMLRAPIAEWERDELVRLKPDMERAEDEREINDKRIEELKRLASKCHE